MLEAANMKPYRMDCPRLKCPVASRYTQDVMTIMKIVSPAITAVSCTVESPSRHAFHLFTARSLERVAFISTLSAPVIALNTRVAAHRGPGFPVLPEPRRRQRRHHRTRQHLRRDRQLATAAYRLPQHLNAISEWLMAEPTAGRIADDSDGLGAGSAAPSADIVSPEDAAVAEAAGRTRASRTPRAARPRSR